MSAQAPSGGFSLFPNTTRPPSRNQPSRPPRAGTPQQGEPSSTPDPSPPRSGRETPLGGTPSRREGKQPAATGHQSAMDRRSPVESRDEPIQQQQQQQQPRATATPEADMPPRTDTAFSEAQTLVRANSNQSRSSIAKRPFADNNPFSTPPEEPALRSIFPQYNPQLPVDRQDYYPTQTSPTHIPRAVISRPLYSPIEGDSQSTRSYGQRTHRSQAATAAERTAAPSRSWPLRVPEAPTVPPTSTVDEVKGLWKVANGWKAGTAEGRVYCLKLSNEKDTPIYTLSSETQPFYHLRIEPNSASAYVTVSRHDPSKPYKGTPPLPTATSPGGTLTRPAENKNWTETLTTTLEESSRKHAPQDGLVSLLYPTAAARAALQKPADMSTVHTAERECARLVWDDDSGAHYLVHPALAMPFCVTIERNPTWSRTEYTLEHIESPQHIARLTRDGTGTGWLEVDTGIAAKINSVYIVDVAITALLLVAHADDAFAAVEVFEPPPGGVVGRGDSRRSSKLSFGRGVVGGGSGKAAGVEKPKAAKKKGRSRMEEFELDIESQTSEFAKMPVVKDKDKDKLPAPIRGLIKVLTLTFKCFIWIATMLFKALMAIITGLAKCLTSEKL